MKRKICNQRCESEMIWDIIKLRPEEVLSRELALRPERGKVVQCSEEDPDN